MEKLLKTLVFALLFFFFWSTSHVAAFVNEGWDWHLVDGKSKRTVHYCAGVAVDYTADEDTVDVRKVSQGLPPQWAGWLSEAVDALNNSNTGWTLVPSKLSFPPCQVLISLADIPENIYGGGVATPSDLNGDGTIDLVRIVLDQTLEETTKNLPGDQDTSDGTRDGWSTDANEKTRDPMGVLMHELTHAMRLDHHPDSSHDDKSDGDLSDPRLPGDHKVSLSEEDLDELRVSSGQEARAGMFEVEPEGQHIKYEGAEFDFQVSTFEFAPAFFDVNIYDGVAIPDPLALPDDFAHVFGSGTIYIRTNQPLQKPVKISIPYTDVELAGGPGMYVGDLHGYVPPAVDEKTMRAFKYVMRPFGVETEETSHWELVENSKVDTENNRVIFETSETGIFGIAGVARSVQPTDISANRSTNKSTLLFGTVFAVVTLAGVFYIVKKRKQNQ